MVKLSTDLSRLMGQVNAEGVGEQILKFNLMAMCMHIVMLHCTLYYDTMNVNSVSYDMDSGNSLSQ